MLEVRNFLNGPINRLGTAKERISELKYILIDTLQTKMQKKQNNKNSKISKNFGNF